MITWPWEWKRRALAAEADMAEIKAGVDVAVEMLEKLKTEKDAMRAQVAQLHAQVRAMSERT